MVGVTSVVAWIGKYKHRISTAVFFGGFLTDLATFTFLNLTQVTTLFTVYLILAALCIALNHYALSRSTTDQARGMFFRRLSIASKLLGQFFVGGLLSGFLIFYTKSASLITSWPFLLLLLIVFFGNEFFRSLRSELAFQVVLLYIALYAYLIYVIPVLMGTLGWREFLVSTGLSLIAAYIYGRILRRIDGKRFIDELLLISVSVGIATGLMVLCYFTNLIPPLPLVLKDAGVYTSVTRSPGGYVLVGEQPHPWWNLSQPYAYQGAANEVSVFSSVFAPGAFSTAIEHEWQRYDVASGSWKREALIAFVLAGGRDAGYRGYSTKTNITPGEWRVMVKTTEGQVLGSVKFTVREGVSPSAPVTEIR